MPHQTYGFKPAYIWPIFTIFQLMMVLMMIYPSNDAMVRRPTYLPSFNSSFGRKSIFYSMTNLFLQLRNKPDIFLESLITLVTTYVSKSSLPTLDKSYTPVWFVLLTNATLTVVSVSVNPLTLIQHYIKFLLLTNLTFSITPILLLMIAPLPLLSNFPKSLFPNSFQVPNSPNVERKWLRKTLPCSKTRTSVVPAAVLLLHIKLLPPTLALMHYSPANVFPSVPASLKTLKASLILVLSLVTTLLPNTTMYNTTTAILKTSPLMNANDISLFQHPSCHPLYLHFP